MPRDMPDAHGGGGLEGELNRTFDELRAPEPDQIDQALAALRAARAVIADKAMMKAIKGRIDESKAAVEQAKE